MDISSEIRECKNFLKNSKFNNIIDLVNRKLLKIFGLYPSLRLDAESDERFMFGKFDKAAFFKYRSDSTNFFSFGMDFQIRRMPDNLELLFFYKGLAEYNLKNYSAAIISFENATKFDHKFLKPYISLCKLYILMKDFSKVELIAEKVILINQNSLEVLTYLAVIKSINYKYPESEILFKRALELDPNSYVLNYNRGTNFIKMGDYVRALISLEKASEIKATNDAYYYLAFVCENLALYKKALFYAEKGLKFGNESKKLIELKIKILGNIDVDLAISESDKYLSLEEHASNIKILKANFLKIKGDYDGALLLLEECLKSSQTSKLLHDIAEIYLIKNMPNKALNNVEMGLLLSPEDPELLKLKDKAYSSIANGLIDDVVTDFLEIEKGGLSQLSELSQLSPLGRDSEIAGVDSSE